MPVAVLGLNSHLYRLIERFHAHYRQDRHHQLRLHKGLGKFGLTDYAADIVRRFYPYLGKDRLGVAAHVILVYHSLGLVALLLGLRPYEDYVLKLLHLLVVYQVSAVLEHIMHQLVGNVPHNENFLLRDTRQVVVECAAIDYVLGGLGDIGGIVYDYRRIARTGADGLFAAGQKHLHNARPTCGNQHLHRGMVDHDIGGLDRRVLDRGNDILRASGGQHRAVYKIYRICRYPLGMGMGVEYNSVAARQHTDTVADNGAAGVGRRGYRADYTVGSHLHQRQAVIAGHRSRLEILRTQRLIRHQMML